MGREDRDTERRTSSARRRAETHVGGFDRTCIKLPEGFSAFQVKAEGVKKLEIAPYRVGKGNPYADEGSVHFERTYFNHRDVGPNGDAYICLAKTLGTACPICEARGKLAKSSDKDAAELAKELIFKERQLWWVRDHAEFDKGWQLWDVSYHLFGKQLDARIKDSDPDDGYDMFYDRNQGSIIKVGFAEKSFGGKAFYEVRSIDFKKREEPLPKSIFEELPCLDDLIIVTPYDKLKRIFLQVPSEDDGDDEAPVKPKAKAPQADEDADAPPVKPKPKPKPVAEDTDEDELPAKPAKKPAKPAADDADDDWDDPAPPAKPAKKPVAAEADEDDPPPPKKPKPKAPPPEEDEDAPPPKKPAKKPAAEERDDDWGDDNWEAPPPKKPKREAE